MLAPFQRPLRLIVAIVIGLRLTGLAQSLHVEVWPKLPPKSIELRPHDPLATSKPWQLPKPGDPLYSAEREAEVNDSEHTQLVHVFERGVFVGYKTLTSGPPPEPAAKELHTQFTPNSELPPDAVELSSSEHPDKSDYFQTTPKTRPANIPPDYILVRVFQGKTLVGWSYLPKDAVAVLHKPDKEKK